MLQRQNISQISEENELTTKDSLELLLSNPYYIEAELCRRDFFYFVQSFWDIIIKDKPVYNWHIPYLCKELETIAWRVIARKKKLYDLVINIPPGTTKSTICTILFPVWCWIARLPKDKFKSVYKRRWRKERKQNPNLQLKDVEITGADTRFITGSYSGALAFEHADYSRDIVLSDRFRKFFPDLYIERDKNLKSHYKNNKGGGRISTSVGGTVTGRHGLINIVDDPINPQGAVSDADRETANQWMSKTLSQRKASRKVTVEILIMQRLHKQDPTGMKLERDSKRDKSRVKHICLPGECFARPDGSCYKVLPEKLKRNYVDGVLDPVRMSRDDLDDAKLVLGNYGYASQIGQNPKPLEGAMFTSTWFEVVSAVPAGEGKTCRGWDLAATSELEAQQSGSTPAYTVGIKAKYHDGFLYIEDMVRGRFNSFGVRRLLKNTASQDGSSCYVSIPQDPGQAGKAQVKSMARDLAPTGATVHSSTETGDKVTRCDPVAAQAEAGNIKLVEGKWNSDFLEYLCEFPNSVESLDIGDALARVYGYLVLEKTKKAGAW